MTAPRQSRSGWAASPPQARPAFGWLLLLLTVLLLGSPALSHAQSVTGLPSPALPSSGSTALSMLRLLGALALVFALFFSGLWLWRNWQRLMLRHGPAPKLTVLEGKSLGQRHTLYVIGYDQQRMLVAASPSGVTMLTTLPAEDPETRPVPVQPAPAGLPAFGALLFRAITQRQ